MENYRLSSYTIFTKLENTEDKYMLVHGYTGAIDIVHENVVSYLKSHSEFLHMENVCFSQTTFDILVKRGYVTQRTFGEEVAYVGRLAKLFHESAKKMYKYFLFSVTYDCNFRCVYCYENNISNKGNDWSRKTFTKEMVDKAYVAMMEIEPERRLHSKVITLYGGEPLLKENREIVEYIVRKGCDLGYRFAAVTNGYDLDCYADLLSPDLISRVQITIDGNREEHDKRRIHYQGKGSFDKILNNVGIALKCDINVAIRVNTDMDNFELLYELKHIFKELGYTSNSKFSFYSALLRNYSNECTDFKYAGQKSYNSKHKQANFEFNCQDASLFANIYRAINKDQLLDIRSTHCVAQSGEYIFDPYGDIYPCWDVLGKKQHILGSYLNDSIEWTEMLKKWHNRNVGTISCCNQCKYALLCNGGCVGLVLHRNKELNANFCNDFYNTFEIAVNRAYDKYISLKN